MAEEKKVSVSARVTPEVRKRLRLIDMSTQSYTESYTGISGQVYRIEECPRCHGELESLGGLYHQTCPQTGYTEEGGVWHCLNPDCNVIISDDDLRELEGEAMTEEQLTRDRDGWLDAAISRLEAKRFEARMKCRHVEAEHLNGGVISLMLHQLRCRQIEKGVSS